MEGAEKAVAVVNATPAEPVACWGCIDQTAIPVMDAMDAMEEGLIIEMGEQWWTNFPAPNQSDLRDALHESTDFYRQAAIRRIKNSMIALAMDCVRAALHVGLVELPKKED